MPPDPTLTTKASNVHREGKRPRCPVASLEKDRNLMKRISCSDQECMLMVIVDGPYYTQQKMKDLRNYVRSSPPRSYALHLGEVPAILDKYVEWEPL